MAHVREVATAVALELGNSNELLRRWIHQDDLDKGLHTDGPTTTEREEVRLLRVEVKTLRMERDLLKNAAAFFAKEIDLTR